MGGQTTVAGIYIHSKSPNVVPYCNICPSGVCATITYVALKQCYDLYSLQYDTCNGRADKAHGIRSSCHVRYYVLSRTNL